MNGDGKGVAANTHVEQPVHIKDGIIAGFVENKSIDYRTAGI